MTAADHTADPRVEAVANVLGLRDYTHPDDLAICWLTAEAIVEALDELDVDGHDLCARDYGEAMDRAERAEDALERVSVLATRWWYRSEWADESPSTEIAAAVAGDRWHQCHGCSWWTDNAHHVTSPALTDGDWFCDDCVSTP